MNWTEAKTAAAGMTAEEMNTALLALAGDPRFPALLALIEQLRRDTIACGCQPVAAAEPGKQSHAWGGVYILELLDAELLQRCFPKPKPAPRRPTQDG